MGGGIALALKALQALSVVPQLVSAGAEVVNLTMDTITALEKMQAEKREPTPEEWEAINTRIAELRARLHA